MADSVRVLNSALDETHEGEVVLRGVIDPLSLTLLQVADYQREILSMAKIDKLMEALVTGRVPDIELGMRGQRILERQGIYYLQDPVFIVDGLQRTSAARRLMELDPEARPYIGAVIHFGTSEEWERRRFDILNLTQTKLSSNVTLRNIRHEVVVADVLYRLTNAAGFVLKGRVSWEQSMKRGELVTATMLFKTAGMLHSHCGPGRAANVVDLSHGLQKIMDNIGRNVFTHNVRTFFDVIDQCWGVQQVAYRHGAVYLKSTFLSALAKLFSEHLDFWKGDRLTIEAPLLRKLAHFPVTDPHVVSLASSAGKASDMLFALLVDHINAGKRTKRLKRRNYTEAPMPPSNGDEDNGEEE